MLVSIYHGLDIHLIQGSGRELPAYNGLEALLA